MRVIDADKLKAHYAWWGGEYGTELSKANKEVFDTIVDLQPTADVRENVHAHWDKVEMKRGEWWHTCSKCKATWSSEDGELDFNFCPNCGAVMDERGEEE